MVKKAQMDSMELAGAEDDTGYLALPPLYIVPIARTDADGVAYDANRAPVEPAVPLGLTRKRAQAWRRAHTPLFRCHARALKAYRRDAAVVASSDRAPTPDELAGICAAIARDATVEPRARIAAVERLSKLLGFDAKPAVAEGPAYALQIVIPQGVTPPPVLAELQGETIMMISPAAPEPTDDGSEF